LIKCLIIDDDEMSREILNQYCAKINDIQVVSLCESGIQALVEIEKQPIDLLFLDIEMPDLSGLELAQNVKNLPQIIFTTSRKDYALEAFDLNVTDYLTKPISFPRLLKAINRAKLKHQSFLKETNDHEMFVKSEGKLIKLAYEEILFLETLDDYLVIHTSKSGKHIVHSTLTAMAKKLEMKPFIKVHRSFIVNLKMIESIEDTHLRIQNKIIPISRSHKKQLMSSINVI